jgi:hypothetical protein
VTAGLYCVFVCILTIIIYIFQILSRMGLPLKMSRVPFKSHRRKTSSKSKRRQKPLRVTCALVTFSLYPSIVRSLYSTNVSLAIMMWACTSYDPGTPLSVGLISKCTGFPIQEVRCFFSEMTRLGFLHIIYGSEDTDSVLYAIEQYFCFEADPTGAAVVYL